MAHREPTTAVLIMLYAVVMVTGVIGNLMVVYTFARGRVQRTVTTALFVNLAICDLTVVLWCAPFSIANEVSISGRGEVNGGRGEVNGGRGEVNGGRGEVISGRGEVSISGRGEVNGGRGEVIISGRGEVNDGRGEVNGGRGEVISGRGEVNGGCG